LRSGDGEDFDLVDVAVVGLGDTEADVVEQCVGWLKEYRRIGTRFEKLAVHFHGMLELAMIRRYLKLLFSDRA